MSRRLKIAIASLVAVGALALALRLKNAPIEMAKTPEPTPAPSSRALGPLLNEPRLEKNETLTPAPQVSAGCLDFWDDLQRLDLLMLSYPPTIDRLPGGDQCTKFPPELTYVHAEYLEKCGPFSLGINAGSDQKAWESKISECLNALYMLRAGISTWNTRDLKLAEITDLQLLSDRLMFSFTKMFSETPDPTDLALVAERMLALDPKIYGATKGLLIAKALDGMFVKPRRGDDAYWEGFQKWVERARDLNSSDPELDDFEFMARTRGYNPADVKREAENAIRQNPNSAVHHNLLGHSSWKLGDRAAASAALKRAIELDPANKEYRATWTAIHIPNAGLDAYRINVKFGVRADQLYK